MQIQHFQRLETDTGTDRLVTLTKLILSQPVLCASAQMVISKQVVHDPMVVPNCDRLILYHCMKWGSIYKKSWLLCRKPVLRNSRWQDSSLIFILFLTTDQICLRVEYDDGKFPDKGVKKPNGMGIMLTISFFSMQKSSNLRGSKMQEVFCFLPPSPKWYLQKQWRIKSLVNQTEFCQPCWWLGLASVRERRKFWVEVAEDTGSNTALNKTKATHPSTEIDPNDVDCTSEIPCVYIYVTAWGKCAILKWMPWFSPFTDSIHRNSSAACNQSISGGA